MILDKETKLRYCHHLANHLDAIENYKGASIADNIASYIANDMPIFERQWNWLPELEMRVVERSSAEPVD